ncbi:hypothetical protein AAG747_12845 [Rapidithrix thailandica]|uniref:Uncharacterized protein n=1 Tax=Rapidithrix thailandica TaxID=413964 RepID=A0AAW9SD64_9BACT
MYQQHLIYLEPRELRRKNDSLELIVIFRDRNSFINWLSSSKVQEYWSVKFKNQLVTNPITTEELDVIIELDNIENCQCKASEFYILRGLSISSFDEELICGTCLKQIPYSRIPLDITIEEWQNYHQRFYLNWLASGFFGKDALGELTNYKNGKLNIEGERIRKQLAEYLEAPVYFNFFVEEPGENHSCPICGSQGSDSGLLRPSKICKDCNSIFD